MHNGLYVVGSPQDSDAGTSSGSTYVFQNVSGTMTQIAKLTASDATAGDFFGYHVAVHANVVVVGAPYSDPKGDLSGSAYVFKTNGITFTQVAKLIENDGAESDYFGSAVAVHGDYIAVSSPFAVVEGFERGAVSIFKNISGTITQIAKISPTDKTTRDDFGRAIDLEGDLLVVGAPLDDDVADNSGAVYVYQLSNGNFSLLAKLVANDGQVGDKLGFTVSVQGDLVVAGALYDDDNGDDSGSAYVFRRSGGTFTQIAKLAPMDGKPGDSFGGSVAVYGDVVLVGAYGADEEENGLYESGKAYVFRNTNGSWSQTLILAVGRESYDTLGVAADMDGDYAVIGAYSDSDSVPYAGSAFVVNVSDI